VKSARTLLAVFAAALLVTAARAQIPSPTGNVYGSVVDEHGEPIAGASVTLAGEDATRRTATDARGDFRFLSLLPGTYSVALEQEGFHAQRLELVVQAGRNAVLDATLRLAPAREEVTVVGARPSSDSRKVETGATYDSRQLRDLPTTRDLNAVLQQVPGVLLPDVNVGNGLTGPFAVGFVGKGTQSDQNAIQLDGAGVSIGGFSPNTYDFDSLDSITIVTGGSDPALATPGVTVNVVTKHGTNELAGSARALYTDGAQWDYGAQAGGPVWRDHVWLWAAGASNAYLGETFHLADGESVRSQETNRNWNAKLTAQPSPSNSFTLGYTRYERLVDGRDAGPLRSEPSTLDVTFPGYSVRVEDDHVLSESLFATLSYAYVPNHRDAVPKGGLDTQAEVDDQRVARGSYLHRSTQRVQHQYGATAASFFSTGALGHELKLGFGYRHAYNQSSSAWPADQLVGNAFDRPNQASVTRAQSVKFLDDFYDAYVADILRSGDWTLSLGLRYDDQRSRNLPSSVGANPDFPDLLPAVRYDGDPEHAISWRSVSPRVSITRAAGDDRRTLLRASYARFANQLGTEVVSVNAFPGVARLDYPWHDANHDSRVQPGEIDHSEFPLDWENVDPDNPGSGAPTNSISPDLKPPMTDEIILAVERQVVSEVFVSVAYTWRRLRGPLYSPPIGASPISFRYEGNAAGRVAGADGFVLDFDEPYYALTMDPPPNGTVLSNRPDTSETYDGVEIQLQKSFSDGWSLRASFAWNDPRQRIGRGGIVDPNNFVPGVNATGPAVAGDIHATWQFDVAGVVVLPLGIQAGVNLFGRQGYPILYSVDAVANDDTRGAVVNLQIGSATDYRTPAVCQLDLQLSRDFRIGRYFVVTPTIAFFNLLDSHTILGREGFAGTYDAQQLPVFLPNESFNTVSENLGPRTIRGGVRVAF
jgi:hypothetical protein